MIQRLLLRGRGRSILSELILHSVIVCYVRNFHIVHALIFLNERHFCKAYLWHLLPLVAPFAQSCCQYTSMKSFGLLVSK